MSSYGRPRMKHPSRPIAVKPFRQSAALLCSAAFLLAATATAPAQQRVTPMAAPVAIANPASVGVSPQRLEMLTAAFNKEITDKALPGVNVMVARKGRIVYAKAFGLRDPAKTEPMAMSTLFRIYSMTK